MYRRAIEDFDRIEAGRDEIQNEPKDFIQTEKKDAVSPLKDLNPHLEISLGIYVPEAADPQSSNSEPVSGQTESGPRVISGPSNPIAA
jgi:hypothetical protein